MVNKKEAILIIAHNNIEILKKIICLLDSEYFDFYIHIDRKSYIEIDEINEICKISKIHIYKELNIRWADFSQVECEMFLLSKAIGNNYTYYHLISGVDFPLKTPKEIFDYFEKCNNKEFIAFESDKIPEHKLEWIKYYYIFGRLSKNSKIIKVIEKISIIIQKILFINRLKGKKIKYMNGDNWFSITNELANYVLNQKHCLKEQYAFTKSPDEIFLQTIVYNSNFKNSLFNSEYNNKHEACMRKIDWDRGRPYIFRSRDYDELINSNCMFARKFDEKVDMEIVDKLYNYLDNKKNEINYDEK